MYFILFLFVFAGEGGREGERGWGGGGLERGGLPFMTSLTPPNANPAPIPARKASRAQGTL